MRGIPAEEAVAEVLAEEMVPAEAVPEEIPAEECQSVPGFNEAIVDLDVGMATTWTFAGESTAMIEPGVFHVYKGPGEEISGPIDTDPDTGVYRVQVPLFCGPQRVTMTWEDGKSTIVQQTGRRAGGI